MDYGVKKKKLKELAVSVLGSSIYREECALLLDKLNLTSKQVIDEYIRFDLDLNAYDNAIYESLENRFVLHLHNLLPGSWHTDNQEVSSNLLSKLVTKNSKIADIGFGVPNRYIKDCILNTPEIKLVLYDLYDSAFIFAAAILDVWNKDWKKQIKFKKTDMNTHEFVGDFDIYIFKDTIEHVEQPTVYLKSYVRKVPKTACFIISIPIGPKIPMHNIVWETEEDALVWLRSCGLEISEYHIVQTNPKVDLFAEGLNFQDVIAVCRVV